MIPNMKTKNGCDPLTIHTNVTGTIKEAKLNAIFAMIFIISLTPFTEITFILLTFIILKNLFNLVTSDILWQKFGLLLPH